MIRLLLVEPYDPFKGEYSFPAPPLGVWRLCGFLRSRGVICDVFSPNLHTDPYICLQETLSEFKADIVGFSTTSMTLPYDLSLVHWAKAKHPNAVYIGGGIGATFEYELALSLSPLDYCVAGEGEMPLLEICRSISDHGSVNRDTRGLIYKGPDGYIKNPNPCLDYDSFREASLSIPYDKMPISDYWDKMIAAECLEAMPGHERDLHIQEIRSVRIMTLNQCPFKCFFCSYSNFLSYANNSNGTGIVRLTAEDATNMIVKIIGIYPEIKTIMFQDDLFVVKKDGRVMDLCDMIIKRKARGDIPNELSFIASCRVDFIDKVHLMRMKSAGFRVIGYGVESFSRNILREYGKEAIYDSIEPTLKNTLESGIKPFMDIILVSPGCSMEDVVYTLNKCIDYIEMGCEVSIYPTVIPFAGSRMCQDPGLEALKHYESVKIPRTHLSMPRATSINPKREKLQEFLVNVDKAMKHNMSNFTSLWSLKRFPSRLRSLIYILSVIESYPGLLHISKEKVMDKILITAGKNA